MQKLVIFVALVAFACNSDAKHFSRCELVHELRRQGFPENLMRDWVCLVESESSGYTNRVGPANTDGSHDYGLFQINDRYWCNNGPTPGKDCNLRCSELLEDNITKAATCAKKIFQRHHFQAWYGWINKCQGGLPDISNC